MKKLWKGLVTALALALCAGACLLPAEAARLSDFNDVPLTHWAYPYVEACAAADLLKGTGGNCYEPEAALTVEQFTVLVGRVCYNDRVLAARTPADSWNAAYVRVARSLGVLDGVETGNMAAPIRRCDMAQMLCNVCERVLGRTMTAAPFGEVSPADYDAARYASAIAKCYQAGFFSGYSDGKFHGERQMTRAQAAKLTALLAGLDTAAAKARAEQSTPKLTVLMYHGVVPDGAECTEYETTVSGFRRDLQWMADRGYRTILPRELAELDTVPEKTVMLTFDDGYANNYALAFPLLREYGAKAAIALVVKDVDWGTEGFLTWEMCREMVDSGLVEIGSHSFECHEFDHLRKRYGIQHWPRETREEYEARVFSDLRTSKEVIQERLGTEVLYFAHPFGTTDKWSEQFIRENFAVTVLAGAGVADLSEGRYGLPRYNINAETGADRFLRAR